MLHFGTGALRGPSDKNSIFVWRPRIAMSRICIKCSFSHKGTISDAGTFDQIQLAYPSVEIYASAGTMVGQNLKFSLFHKNVHNFSSSAPIIMFYSLK